MSGGHLLVRAGATVCALPVAAVRRVLRPLPLHPLPGAGPALRGLAEYAGEPLPVLDLARLLAAPPGGAAACPVTVVAWAGEGAGRELVGLAADAALAVVAELPEGVRLLDLAALAGGRA